jgi:hypothetical protein
LSKSDISDFDGRGEVRDLPPAAASQKRVLEQPEAGFRHHINGAFATDIMVFALASAGLAGFVAKARR